MSDEMVNDWAHDWVLHAQQLIHNLDQYDKAIHIIEERHDGVGAVEIQQVAEKALSTFLPEFRNLLDEAHQDHVGLDKECAAVEELRKHIANLRGHATSGDDPGSRAVGEVLGRCTEALQKAGQVRDKMERLEGYLQALIRHIVQLEESLIAGQWPERDAFHSTVRKIRHLARDITEKAQTTEEAVRASLAMGKRIH